MTGTSQRSMHIRNCQEADKQRREQCVRHVLFTLQLKGFSFASPFPFSPVRSGL